jgi:acylphosphatase
MTLFQALSIVVLLFVSFVVAGAEPPKEKQVARTVYYSGSVQGVGFRATVVDIARSYPVTGWVKNLSDGRVQVVVEGSEEEVKKFLDAVRKRWMRNIEKELAEEMKPAGTYKGFTIMR